MDDHAIIAHDLCKTFGSSVTALDNLNLSVATGTVLGLLGPNGAGKTTAVRVFSTILTPDSGRAEILGHDVVRQADQVRHLIGLAGQFATVDENLTGRENLTMMGRLSHLAKRQVTDRTAELLEHFNLVDASDRPLKTYSGGMRRRLDIAAALMGQPPVLFLDEPTTGLDPSSRQDVWQIVSGLVAGGTTVLLTTQYLEEADQLADRIAVVDHGTVIAEGTAASLKADLGSTVIVISLPDVAVAQQVAPIFADTGTNPPHINGSSVEITVEDGPRIAMEVLRELDRRQISIDGLVLREPSLDDVFLSLTGHRAELDDDNDENDDNDEEAETKKRRGRRQSSATAPQEVPA